MLPGPTRHRRARRTDFDAIGAILAEGGLPAPTSGPAARRHFRRLVADLGADLYVAENAARVVGVVHVTYTRPVTGAPQARLELLAVAAAARGQGVGRGLAALAAARARRRGCTSLRCSTATAPEGSRALLDRRFGWRPVGEEFEFDLARPAQ
jgi:ribosomal protein S18 acetylase RimI-like enzyme